ALHARKAFKKLLDRVPGFQMIEETLSGHPRPGKHRLAPKHLGILRNDAAHASNVKIKTKRKRACYIRLLPSSLCLSSVLLQDGEYACWKRADRRSGPRGSG